MNRSKEGGRRRSPRALWATIAGALVLVLLAMDLIPLSYYVYAPGSAERVQPLIDVTPGHRQETGAFYLTTVYVVPVQNVYELLYGLLLPHHQLLPATQVSAGLSVQTYNDIEQYMMSSSHQNAIEAALHYLQIPFQVKTTGILVMAVESNSKARSLLMPQDVITSIDGTSLAAHPEALYTALLKKHPGQTVRLSVLRNGKSLAFTVPLIALSGARGQPVRAGIGIFPALAQKLVTPVKVRFDTGNIDGPSAGLMFTLEIVNQLYKHGDLTRGYRIAGTGTISADGSVGQIGGVAHKVVDAIRAGAQIFFVPADVQAGDTNTAHALAEAKADGTSMRIVPVKTLAQAIAYLRHLPENHHR